MTSPDNDPLVDRLRAGPPEERSYVPPGLPAPSHAVGGRVSVRRLHGTSERTSPVAAVLGVAAMIAVLAFGLLAGGAHLLLPSPTATAVPSGTTAKLITPAPTTGGGWPAVLPAAYAGGPYLFAADGTFYVAGPDSVLSLDARGAVAPGWPVHLPQDAQPIGLSLDPTGGVYVHSTQSLIRVAQTGIVRDGWPAPIGSQAWDPVVRDGLVAMIEPRDALSRVVVLNADGSAPKGWPIDVPGEATGELAVAADGGVLMTLLRSGVPTIVAIASDGRLGAGWMAPGWQHFILTSSGNILAWSYLDKSGNVASAAVSTTRFAVLGPTGTVRPGWPITLLGAMSAPVLEPSGTIVAVLSGSGTSARDQLVAWAGDGTSLAGWPVQLAGPALSSATTTNEPDVPTAPIIAGSLVLVAESGTNRSSVEAFLEDGQHASGWPFVLPDGESFVGMARGVPGSPWLLPVPANADGIFLASRDSAGIVIRRLKASGSTAAGWPQRVPDLTISAWVPLDDGGLEVAFTSSVPQITVMRFALDGSVSPAG